MRFTNHENRLREILSHYYTGVSISASGSSGGGFFGWLHSLFHW